jgi:hypothetical protein
MIKEGERDKQNDSRNGSEVRKNKVDARNKGEESNPAPGGKNVQQAVLQWG